MNHTFLYKFDELPLAVVDGVEAAYVSGQAEIEILPGGYYIVGDVSLEGMGERVNGVRQWPMIPAPAPIAAIIRDYLYSQWRSRIINAGLEQLEEAA